MSSLILKKINNKATNYSVERKSINGCASDGYIFTSKKIVSSLNETHLLAMQLIYQDIIQSVEIYSADKTSCFILRKIQDGTNGTRITSEMNSYSVTDYFSDQDRGKDLVVIKITTFDTPSKHLKKISTHRNSFFDVLKYFLFNEIQALTYLYPVLTPNKESTSSIQLELINCDQSEYRLNQLVINNVEFNYFNFEMMVGEENLPELLIRIGQNQFSKIKGVYCIAPKRNHAFCAINQDVNEHEVINYWMNQGIHKRDSHSIFDINIDYISLLVEIKRKDMTALKNLKTGKEALQYICK
ncbi:hypothetical protein D3C74_277510 [compost metagenome]